jgi:hypothetical protein
VSLLTADWPTSVAAVGAVRGIDGRSVALHPCRCSVCYFCTQASAHPCGLAHRCRYTFRGPRVAMAIHSSSEWDVTYDLTSYKTGADSKGTPKSMIKPASSGFAMLSSAAAAAALPRRRSIESSTPTRAAAHHATASHATGLQHSEQHEAAELVVGAAVAHPSRGLGVIKAVDYENERGKPIRIQYGTHARRTHAHMRMQYRYTTGEIHQYSLSSAKKLRLADEASVAALSRRRSEGHLHALSLQSIYVGPAVEHVQTLARCLENNGCVTATSGNVPAMYTGNAGAHGGGRSFSQRRHGRRWATRCHRAHMC